jgi:hypothetical protein
MVVMFIDELSAEMMMMMVVFYGFVVESALSSSDESL